MSDANDLKELAQKAATGDKAAFEELYRTTCRSVYFTCLGFLKDEQEAQDVTQEVYMTVFEQLGALEDKSKFKPWLYRIAANKSINCLKKKQPLLPGDEQLEDMETEDNENFLPEEYVLNADKRELVLEIMRKVCSDVLYQTILLYYFNEFSIAEIAEIMDCPEGTVKYRLSVARAKIKEGVLQYEEKSGDKLYSFGAVPFLMALFTAQLQDIQMPSISLGFLGAPPQSNLAAPTAKTGGSNMLKSLQLKIAAGVAAAIVAVGGIIAATVIIRNQNENTPSITNTPSGNTGNTNNNISGSAEQNIPDGPINVKDYYTATEIKGEYGYYTEYTFDTSKFQSDRFDGKLFIHDIEVTLPFTTIADLQEQGIDMSRNSYADEDDLLKRSDVNVCEPGAKPSTYADIYCGKLADGELDWIFRTNITIQNQTDVQIDSFDAKIICATFDSRPLDDVDPLSTVFALDSNHLNVDSIVERFGIPIFYTASKRTLYLFYYYEDYTFLFSFKREGSNAGNIDSVAYYSSDYIDYYRDTASSDFMIEYITFLNSMN